MAQNKFLQRPTPREQEMLAILADYQVRLGRLPTMKELVDEMQSHRGVVVRWLTSLEEQGFLKGTNPVKPIPYTLKSGLDQKVAA